MAALLVAAFLAVTGVAKLWDPTGTPPESAMGLLEFAPWSTWLRLMGGVEVAVALLLAVPRTREAGRYVAFVLVAGLTALVALNAHDAGFASSCGCMGALASRSSGPAEVDLLLVRNAVLLTLIVLSHAAAAPTLSTRGALVRAGTVGALVLLAAMAAAQRVRADHLRETLRAETAGRGRASKLGWELPDVAVVDADGAVRGLRSVVRPGDEVLVVSTQCPHCADVGRDVKDWLRRLEASGARLVLLVVPEGPTPVRDWLREHGMEGPPAYAFARRGDVRHLGVDSVPARILLGPDRRVIAHEEHGGMPSLLDPLFWTPALPAELRTQVWQHLAEAAASGARAEEAPRRAADGSFEGALRLADGTAGRLLVRRDGFRRSYGLELAIALDASGRIAGAVPVAAGSHAAPLPDVLREILDSLRGSTPDEARKWLREQFSTGVDRGALARSAYLVIEHVGISSK